MLIGGSAILLTTSCFDISCGSVGFGQLQITLPATRSALRRYSPLAAHHCWTHHHFRWDEWNGWLSFVGADCALGILFFSIQICITVRICAVSKIDPPFPPCMYVLCTFNSCNCITQIQQGAVDSVLLWNRPFNSMCWGCESLNRLHWFSLKSNVNLYNVYIHSFMVL